MRSVEILTESGRCFTAKIDAATSAYLYAFVVAKEPDKYLEITDVVDGAYIAVKSANVESIIITEVE